MSPDPKPLKTSGVSNEKCPLGNCGSNKTNSIDLNSRTSCHLNDKQTMQENNTTEYQKCSDIFIKVPALFTGREKRIVSSPSCILHETYGDPHSPSSSSCTSQATNDATFEPTIEMMVNDFDDEQTLNEEEALASLELQDADDEINTLKKESEMPLEELLAKYRDLPHFPPPNLYQEPLRKKTKKVSSHNKCKQNKKEFHAGQSNKNNESSHPPTKIVDTSKYSKVSLEALDAKGGDRNNLGNDEDVDNFEEKCPLSLRKPFTQSVNKDQKEANSPSMHSEISKVRRSHLLDLYPEGTFDNVVASDTIAGNSKESLFGGEYDEEVEEEDYEDYKKKVMIGPLYQATIPVGLSLYGDILPYENEDKLIWEPCQVSEREVEEYLIKIRDIKSNQQGEEDDLSVSELNSENQSKENGRSGRKIEDIENNSFLANGKSLIVEMATMDMDSQSVVKDNEQALHLLVQCGYDFKEALRRKRLNALPLNDCMSLWSEEECHKFEEGIQKYGKDFLKIRQNQVRTRTMRELVQFYYLWKKSERRDHNFANADTVDHMDIYLNEDNEYGSNPSSVLSPEGSPDDISNCAGTGRNSIFSQKNISIMTSATQTNINLTSEKTVSNTCLQQHYHQQQHLKRRTHSGNQASLNGTTSDFSSETLCKTSNANK